MKRLILVLLIVGVVVPTNLKTLNPFAIETMVKEEVVKEVKKFVVTMTTYTIDPDRVVKERTDAYFYQCWVQCAQSR